MPHIPQHLQESVPSAQQYEFMALREYQIAMMRWRMGVTAEQFVSNEAIKRYVSVRRDTEAMADRLRWPELQAVITTQTPLFVQLRQAGRLYMVARTVLAEGFEGSVPVTQVGSMLDMVVRRHGLQVWADPWAVEVRPDAPFVEPTDVWSCPSPEPMPSPPWHHPRGDTGWYWPDMAGERRDPAHMRALTQEAERQGIPGALAGIDPATHVMLSALVYGRDLVSQTENPSGLPSAPGLAPDAPTRLRRVAGLYRLAVASIEEAIQPGRLTSKQVLTDVRLVLTAYGLPTRNCAEKSV